MTANLFERNNPEHAEPQPRTAISPYYCHQDPVRATARRARLHQEHLNSPEHAAVVARWARVGELYLSGFTMREAGSAVGLTMSGAKYALDRSGIARRHPVPKPRLARQPADAARANEIRRAKGRAWWASQPRAALFIARNADIVRQYLAGARIADLARQFGIHRKRVSQIVEKGGRRAQVPSASEYPNDD